MADITPVPDAQSAYLNLLLESGCKFLFRTIIAGKEYVWVKDKYGQIFLERVPEPTYSGASVGPIEVDDA